MQKTVWSVASIGALFLCVSGIALGYEIGPGDVLEMEIWQQPDFTSTVVVYGDGSVVLPVIGSINVGEMTPAEAGTAISKRYSMFDPRISEVTVRVREFNYRSVFVLGEVAAPGRYGFEEIPDLLAVLSRAGGPTDAAALSSILVIGAEPGRDARRVVDLDRAMNEGDLTSLPQLRRGDLIWIPDGAGSAGANRVSVLGEVIRPGMYAIGTETDVLDLLLAAGGPTDDADLRGILLMRTAKGAVTVNLQGYLERGERDRIPRIAGDDVIVVREKSRFWSNLWNGFRETVTVVGALAATYFIYDQLVEE